MSRIGNQSILIPQTTTVTVVDKKVEIKGPKGQLTVLIPKQINLEIKNNEIIFTANNSDRKVKALHGLIRSITHNTILGVNQGWSKTLSLIGVGFRATIDGKILKLYVGYSHPVEFIGEEGISFTINGNDVTVLGIDKQLVGETAAKIRRIKPPEVYKGKGIRYKNELIHLKPGKAAKTAGVGTATK